MLDFIRKNASSVILKVILGIIALVFVFWGVGSFQSNRLTTIASINGDKILYEEYRLAYTRAIERYQQMFQGRMPQGFLDSMNIKGQVLDNLIDNKLVMKAAKQLGVRASDEEVKQAILAIPTFQQEGKFDKDIYEKLLRSHRLTPVQFEADIRTGIVGDKTKAMILNMVQLSGTELEDFHRFEHAEKQLTYGVLETSVCLPEVKITDEELQVWYEAQKEAFKTEPQIELKYLMFDENEVAKTINIDGAEILAYYDSHTSEFDAKEERKARHILLKTQKDATDAQQEEVRLKAEELLKKLRSGASFEPLAQKYSEDPGSATKGGDLGFFGRGMMVPAFEQTVFSMEPGQISELVKTQFGWHIIKLEDIKPGGIRPLEEVRGKIEAKLKKEKAKELTLVRANETYEKIMLSGSLDAFVKENAMPIQMSGRFSEKNVPPSLGLSKDGLKAIFAMEKGGLSSLLNTAKGMMIAEVIEKQPSVVPQLDAVKEKAIAKFKAEKAEALCLEKGNNMLKQAKAEGSLEKILKDAGIEPKKTGFFKTSDSSANGSLPAQAAEVAAELSSKNKIAENAVKVGDKTYLVAFAQDKELRLKPSNEEIIATKERLLRQKQESFYKDWITSLRQNHKIEINQRLMQS